MRALVSLAVFTYALSLLACLWMGAVGNGVPLRASTSESESESESANAIEQRDDAADAVDAPVALPSAGFALNVHHIDDVERYLTAVDRIAAMGMDSLEVLTPAFQRDGAADEIRFIVGPGRGPTREMLEAVVARAHGHGLRVSLMPVVLFTHPRGNEWRGKIHPDDWNAWWASYEQFIVMCADFARENNIYRMSVGSELLSTERSTRQWTRVIEKVRERFSGQLTYSTNWDHYDVPSFWGQLDAIGINGYWDLTRRRVDKDKATQDELDIEHLIGAWRDIREEVIAFAQARGKPILFTEIGYPSLPGALKEPWNYVNSQKAAADPRVQALGYRAFLAAWDDVLGQPAREGNMLAGVFFYEWDVYRAGGSDDTGYGVAGKPAYELIENWAKGRRDGGGRE